MGGGKDEGKNSLEGGQRHWKELEKRANLILVISGENFERVSRQDGRDEERQNQGRKQSPDPLLVSLG